MADNLHDWLKFAGHCMSDAGWEVAVRTPDVLLSHRSCPWGGHLIKVESKNIFIQNAPTDSRDFFARPEVEAKFHCDECTMKCMDINAPGDALIERTNTMWIIRFASVLFGDCMGHSLQQRFFFNKMPVVSRHCLYKDFPQPGSSAYYENESLWIAQPLPVRNRYCVVAVFSAPKATWAPWASPFIRAFATMLQKAVERVFSSPRYQDIRAMCAKMYMILSMRSFMQGHPMIPQSERRELSDCSDGLVTVSTGLQLGLMSWTQFNAGKKFYLSEYLQCFMGHLGHKMKTYNVMDGRKLVSYQCVVVRQEWDELKNSFFDAFRVQRAAYRRAHGGTLAPSLVQDASPRWDEQACYECCEFPAAPAYSATKTTVRKTFLEIEEDFEDSPKRSNSTGVLTCLV